MRILSLRRRNSRATQFVRVRKQLKLWTIEWANRVSVNDDRREIRAGASLVPEELPDRVQPDRGAGRHRVRPRG
jgi:hypothetical protein